MCTDVVPYKPTIATIMFGMNEKTPQSKQAGKALWANEKRVMRKRTGAKGSLVECQIRK